MLYLKLAIRNVRRSMKDYLIYVVTLVLAIGMFYGFFSLVSPYYSATLPHAIHLEELKKVMRVAVPLVGLLALFLMVNVNAYMLRRKQMEFAVETVIGMEQRTVAFLFFIETLAIGLVAMLLGVLFGMVMAQVLSIVVVQAFGEVYHFHLAFYPDTLIGTFVFFGVLSLGMGLGNLYTVRRMKIIDMLEGSRRGIEETSLVKALRLWVVTAFLAVIGIFATMVALCVRLWMYPTIFLRFLLMVILAFFLLAALWRFLVRGRKGMLTFVAVASLALGAGLLMQMETIDGLVQQRLAPPVTLTLVPVLALFLLAFGMVAAFCGLSSVVAALGERRPAFYWRHLFLIGQLRSRFASAAKRMGVIACVLAAALVLFAFLPVLAIRIQSYQEVLSVYEVQVGTMIRTEVREMPTAPLDDKTMTAFLEDGGYEVTGTASGTLYLLDEADLALEDKTRPIFAVTLSDYNALRHLSGLAPLTLAADRYAVAWNNTSLDATIADFDRAAPEIKAGDMTLAKTPGADFKDPLGISLFTSQTEAVYIIPDKAAERLQRVTVFYAANTAQPLSYEFAKCFEQEMAAHQQSLGTVSPDALFIRLHTLQANEGVSSMLSIMLLGAYMALVLLVSSFTMLSVQQLVDAIEQSERFTIIGKLGVDSSERRRTVRQQMGVWFGLPVVTALVMSGCVLAFLVWRTYKDIVAYMSMTQVAAIFAIVYGSFLLIFACYFTATYYLFSKNIRTV